MKTLIIMKLCIAMSSVFCWDTIPAIPSNRRTQFYLRNDDGGYKYGYDSGDGLVAKQESTADNQVQGFYTAQNADGRIVNVKYTAGVQGFVPEVEGITQSHNEEIKILPSRVESKVQSRVDSGVHTNAWKSKQHVVNVSLAPPRIPLRSVAQHQDGSSFNSDASYQLSYNTGEHAREEQSDASGNVQGRYSYVDEAGEHDLSYIAGPEIGFQVTGGSLSEPNGLIGKAINAKAQQGSWSQPKAASFQQVSHSTSKPQIAAKSWTSSDVQPSSDGSYSFSYNTGDQSRTESSDSSGNVQGRYAYSDEAGQHDLSYVAGADTGFVVTGGSLSDPNGLVGKAIGTKVKQVSWSQPKTQQAAWSPPQSTSWPKQQKALSQSSWSQAPIQAVSFSNRRDFNQASSGQDAYAFAYDTDSHSRQESSDGSGRVRGSFAVQTDGGHQQFNYETGNDGSTQAQDFQGWDQAASRQSPAQQWDQSSLNFGQQQFQDDFEQPNFDIPSTHRMRIFNLEKSAFPTFTIITPKANQKSFEYGQKSNIVLGYLPPQHSEKHGYIYDSEHA